MKNEIRGEVTSLFFVFVQCLPEERWHLLINNTWYMQSCRGFADWRYNQHSDTRAHIHTHTALLSSSSEFSSSSSCSELSSSLSSASSSSASRETRQMSPCNCLNTCVVVALPAENTGGNPAGAILHWQMHSTGIKPGYTKDCIV